MKNAKQELQSIENENKNAYQLRSNQELIDIISEFGNGETEFHTLDISRLIEENRESHKLIKMFEEEKTRHELPNNNHGEYNQGYVKAMRRAINHLKAVF